MKRKKIVIDFQKVWNELYITTGIYIGSGIELHIEEIIEKQIKEQETKK